MSNLGDDELALILNWVSDENDRSSCSLVCKQWLRVEGLTRLSIRVIEPDLIPNFIHRFPNLLAFESSRLIKNTHLKFLAKTCSKLQHLNLDAKQFYDESLGCDDFGGDDGVCCLANGCCNLIKVSLRRRRSVGNFGVVSLVKTAVKLTTLNLGRCDLIDDSSLEAIGSMNSIRVLNLQACFLITDCGLEFLATGSCSRTLKKLVLAECDRITDFGVSFLHRMVCLEELNLAECGPQITDIGGLAIASVTSLKRLNMSWLINVSDDTITAIANNCIYLVALELTGCETVTGTGITAFASHRCLESLVLASWYSVCGNVIDRLLNCKSLSYLVLALGVKMWVPDEIVERASKTCELQWR